MTKKQFAEIICKKFSLKGITPSSFVYVLNCMLIGIVMVKVPGKNAYKLYFSIYPLWMSNLKECLDMPLFQQPILNNKNMDIYLPENMTEYGVDFVLHQCQKQVPFIPARNIPFNDIVAFLHRILKNSTFAGNFVLKMKVYRLIYSIALICNDFKTAESVYKTISQSIDQWDDTIFQYWYGDKKSYLNQQQEYDSNKIILQTNLQNNLQNPKICKMPKYTFSSQFSAPYTKHIYIGSQRIVSKIGDFASYGSDPRRIQYAGRETDGLSLNYKQKYSAQQQVIKDNYAIFEVPYNGTDNNDYVDGQGFCCDDGSPEAAQARALALENNFQDPDAYEKLQFYYHPDHLGSSSYITNLDGEVVQHIEYVPFGEVFIEERNSIWNTPYLFNAKEFDEETGLYYYGARYYEPRVSLWISTDPMQEKTSNITTYAYCINNPVAYIDHDGKFSKKWMANISRTWYNLWHKQKAGPIIENKDATTSKFKYTYNTYSVNNGEFAITSHYKFDTTASQRVQDIGDGISLAGYATTLSVVGAEVGVPMSVIGNTISSVGSAGELVLNFANGDMGDGLKGVAFRLLEKGTEKVLNKFLPGFGKKIGEEGFNLGTEIIDQGRKLKQSGVERLTDIVIEKKRARK